MLRLLIETVIGFFCTFSESYFSLHADKINLHILGQAFIPQLQTWLVALFRNVICTFPSLARPRQRRGCS